VLLTAVGVMIGTAAVVTLVSLGAGLQKAATESLWGIGDLSSITVYPTYSGGGGGKPYMVAEAGGSEDQQDAVLLTPSMIKDIEALPGVKRVIIQDYLSVGSEIKLDKLSTWGSIQGVSVSDLAEMNLEAAQGTTELGMGKIVVGATVNRNFYDPNQRPDSPPIDPPDLMGKILNVTLIKYSQEGVETRRTYRMEVVGVLKETRGESDYNMYMTLDEINRWNEWGQGRRINREKEGYNQVIVKAESPQVVLDVTDQITN